MAAQHQHYVPQLLLRGFLSRDPQKASKEQVHVLDLQTGASFTPSIANIMGERRFNDFWLDEETLATIEPAVGRIESYISPLVERLRSERRLQLSPEEQGDLALLMAFQFLRTRKMRLLPERLNRQIKAHVERMGLDPGKIKGLLPDDEESLKREHVRHQLEGLEGYTNLIAAKQFFLMSAPAGSSFYLGDHPVVMHNDEERRGPMGQLGLGVPYVQIYLPISADVMLCAYDRAIIGQLMRTHEERMQHFRGDALARLAQGQISIPQMKQMLDGVKAADEIPGFIDAIRSGPAIELGLEQMKAYNSLQAFQAHRFVVDPDGKFTVAAEVMAKRTSADIDPD